MTLLFVLACWLLASVVTSVGVTLFFAGASAGQAMSGALPPPGADTFAL